MAVVYCVGFFAIYETKNSCQLVDNVHHRQNATMNTAKG